MVDASVSVSTGFYNCLCGSVYVYVCVGMCFLFVTESVSLLVGISGFYISK